MNKILVAYTTNSGTTEEVAQAIGEELGKRGNAVDVRRLEEVTSLEGYQAVVVGAPMILGWHRAAREIREAALAGAGQAAGGVLLHRHAPDPDR